MLQEILHRYSSIDRLDAVSTGSRMMSFDAAFDAYPGIKGLS